MLPDLAECCDSDTRTHNSRSRTGAAHTDRQFWRASLLVFAGTPFLLGDDLALLADLFIDGSLGQVLCEPPDDAEDRYPAEPVCDFSTLCDLAVERHEVGHDEISRKAAMRCQQPREEESAAKDHDEPNGEAPVPADDET